MEIVYPDRLDFARALKEAPTGSFDLIVVATAALDPISPESVKPCLTECARALRDGGLLFVQGRPDYLPELGVFLERHLTFKYWIAVKSIERPKEKGLPSVHAGILFFTKGNGRFNIKPPRLPHRYCAFCKRPLKDWGGKTHLMHPDGYVVSDVWLDLPPADNHTQISDAVLDMILQMVETETSGPNGKASFSREGWSHTTGSELRGVIGPKEGLHRQRAIAEIPVQYRLPGFTDPRSVYGDAVSEIGDRKFDVVHLGDALKVLKRYPDNSIDLVFADPPYNLDKPYSIYDDERADYLAWCNAWLAEYVRVLKPTGSLYVLNLPRWTMHHAAFLSQHLHFQNWIVWDALSEPRGKLMPAHYGLLFYTKHPTDFTFNYDEVGLLDARHYCRRASCIRQRKARGADDKEHLTDIWWNIHRIKHRRDRDYHPCQLPEALMERIIRLSTNPGDIVLDAFSGTGTTAVVAAQLGRRYVAIDLDEEYVGITRQKIAEVERAGYVKRESIRKTRQRYTKKELQLELRGLANRLGRLPTPEDVKRMSEYDVRAFLEMFPTWGKALKAAKLEVRA